VRISLIGFAMGVAWLQQQAVLPTRWDVGLLILALLFAYLIRRFRSISLLIAALALGFGYAAWRAETRLQTELPTAFEGRNIELTGFVRGLPSPGEESTRFLFEVESNDARLKNFPPVVQLSWPAVDASRRGPSDTPPPSLWAG
jgi:competence protein ComEC